LGVAYKRNVDDSRESPFYEIRELLISKGANVTVYDSWISTENTHSSLEDALKNVSGALIVTDHSDMMAEFMQLDLLNLGLKVVVDGRNALDQKLLPDSILFRGIGRR
jgi:UDP-N-acetyl-D-glucosamine dehydrogenase